MKRRRLFAFLAAAPLAATVPAVATKPEADWITDSWLSIADRHPGAEIVADVSANRLRWFCYLAGQLVEAGASYSPEYVFRYFERLKGEIVLELPEAAESDEHILNLLAVCRLATGHASAGLLQPPEKPLGLAAAGSSSPTAQPSGPHRR